MRRRSAFHFRSKEATSSRDTSFVDKLVRLFSWPLRTWPQPALQRADLANLRGTPQPDGLSVDELNRRRDNLSALNPKLQRWSMDAGHRCYLVRVEKFSLHGLRFYHTA